MLGGYDMALQFSLFNHKGGVSKTTTAFNLGWMLAQKGKRVLLVDCDPQCNLTGMVLGYRGYDDFASIYQAGGVRNIHQGLSPAFESRPALIQPVECEPIKGQPNMYLLPGHIGLAEYEVTLGISQELSSSIITLQNLPGSLNYLFQITAEKYNADIILVDMSPSLGPINQNVLMTSNYFLVPMAPDYFSVMATRSLASILPKWMEWARKAQGLPGLTKATYPFPKITPKFIGTVVQNYRQREGQIPSIAFQKWINEIETEILTTLAPQLEKCGMLLSKEAYDKVGVTIGKPIMQMPNFNSLIALSQKHKVPIYALSDKQLEQTGIVLERTKKSMHKFRDIYSKGADKIISLITP
jgi:cellulose biosynthesis protein BcsQ